MCTCHIIPKSVLEALAKDAELSEESRAGLANTALIDDHFREARIATGHLMVQAERLAMAPQAPAPPPKVLVNDCHHATTLPGTPVNNPGHSPDSVIKAAYDETVQLESFFKGVFHRNSINNRGMDLLSSVHYGVKYNNAFWNGSQMTYGDGDGQIFLEFVKGLDVVAHEITHGVTQFTLQLAYANEAGGLNESVSDVFGSMFLQWALKQDVNHASWLIGGTILGPVAKARGFTCLRDMANPAARHCLAPQITKYADYRNGMDPHISSGVPNLAFYTTAKAYGGNSWGKVGEVWYSVLTKSGAQPNMSMKQFADACRKAAKTIAAADAKLQNAVDSGWKAVGL